MATGRMARVIDNLLTAAEQAADEQAWDRVLDLCEDVLAVEPDNPDASALRLLAERHVGRAIPAAGRRQVTVLFADLVGSTPMGEQLDPETYLEVIRAYETACRPVIDRYGGHINRFAGDGLIAFFGYPNAHEDDARRATRAGVEALEALRIVSERTASEHGVEIAARIGVHTGLVVLGDRGSAAWTGRDDAFGPTVNLAARLQAVATPGTVVVSDSVALLLGPAIELVSHGPRTLTGVPRSVEVFEVVRVVDGGRAPQALARAKLVDRKDQLDDLTVRLDSARAYPDGPGRAVVVQGEPGVGKSRLLIEVLDAASARAGRHLTLQCSPYLTTSSLHAVRDAIQRQAGIGTDDAAGTRLDKLVALVERLGLDAGDMVPYLAIPLSIDVRGRFDPVELDALQLKDELLSHLVALFERLPSSGTPFVVAVEDVQWADPMTLDLLERLVRGGPPSGVLLVATTRPSSTSPVANLPADVIELGPLTADDARALAADTADRRLDEALLDEIARRGQGGRAGGGHHRPRLRAVDAPRRDRRAGRRSHRRPGARCRRAARDTAREQPPRRRRHGRPRSFAVPPRAAAGRRLRVAAAPGAAGTPPGGGPGARRPRRRRQAGRGVAHRLPLRRGWRRQAGGRRLPDGRRTSTTQRLVRRGAGAHRPGQPASRRCARG